MASFFGGRDERYKLRGGVDLVIEGGARDALLEQIAPYCHQVADNIAVNANGDSSWGAYESYHQPTGATVVGLSATDGERARRLLTALGLART